MSDDLSHGQGLHMYCAMTIVMGMPDACSHLMGAHEIRMRLGSISRQRTYQITSNPGFPKPVATLSQGNVWLRDDVEQWICIHRPDARQQTRTPPT
ncbi:hypothetical protein Asp14428_33010 [Actinoplanes sp. NBRC 14428]|nr:hypothetical protein Asp14428_33010 [Actinoplanes sp. NBRC 14428]